MPSNDAKLNPFEKVALRSLCLIDAMIASNSLIDVTMELISILNIEIPNVRISYQHEYERGKLSLKRI